MSSPNRTILSTWREPGKVAIDAAQLSDQRGSDLCQILVDALSASELDPNLIAIGLGSLPNADGVIELDASIMDGLDLSAGAVCSVQDICPVIQVANLVRTQTPHVLLAGSQARRFALEHGFQAQDLTREPSQKKYEEWKTSEKSFTKRDYIHAINDLKSAEKAAGQHVGDTVTVLGWESGGHVASASSTSGLSWKLPGRVGDSPIIGAGIYADNEVGCAGATGYGEELWKGMASFRAVEYMERGASPQEACEKVIHHIHRRQPHSRHLQCVVLAMNQVGNYGAATNSGIFTLWVYQNGSVQSIDFAGLYD